jgi:UrcA family protein
MSKHLVNLLALACALAISGFAAAGTKTEIPSVVVKYSDLTLSTKAGVASLHSRIRNAAEAVCSPMNSRILGLRQQYEACVSDAVAEGVASVGNANLSNYHLYGSKAVLVASN